MMPHASLRARERAGTSQPATNAAFGAFVGPHLSIMRALAAREVGIVDADDVLQEALLRAWHRWSTYDPQLGSPRAWLCAVVLDKIRRHRVRRRASLGPDEVRELLAIDEQANLRMDVERAIADLPRRQRQVINLFYIADLQIDEIATVLKIAPGSVKRHLFDARAALRTSLREQVS
jgi:RNA polymerase sigma-70 factor, ECF subfamily